MNLPPDIFPRFTRWCGIVALSALVLVATGCERRLSNANLRAVLPEMTTKEVESILGQPDRIDRIAATPVSPEGLARIPATTHYFYEQDNSTVEFTFVNDRLIPDGIKGSFETP